MTIVRRPSPFGELVSLCQAMGRVLDNDLLPRTSVLAGGTGGGALSLDATTAP